MHPLVSGLYLTWQLWCQGVAWFVGALYSSSRPSSAAFLGEAAISLQVADMLLPAGWFAMDNEVRLR